MAQCGYITHVKNSTAKPKGHKSFADAVEYAKKQTKPTGVLSVCGPKVRRLALCSNGGCGGSTEGLAGARRRGRKKRAKKRAKRRS